VAGHHGNQTLKTMMGNGFLQKRSCCTQSKQVLFGLNSKATHATFTPAKAKNTNAFLRKTGHLFANTPNGGLPSERKTFIKTY
jgi:hypothetical protein